jgi:hypothetical protein
VNEDGTFVEEINKVKYSYNFIYCFFIYLKPKINCDLRDTHRDLLQITIFVIYSINKINDHVLTTVHIMYNCR